MHPETIPTLCSPNLVISALSLCTFSSSFCPLWTTVSLNLLILVGDKLQSSARTYSFLKHQTFGERSTIASPSLLLHLHSSGCWCNSSSRSTTLSPRCPRTTSQMLLYFFGLLIWRAVFRLYSQYCVAFFKYFCSSLMSPWRTFPPHGRSSQAPLQPVRLQRVCG